MAKTLTSSFFACVDSKKSRFIWCAQGWEAKRDGTYMSRKKKSNSLCEKSNSDSGCFFVNNKPYHCLLMLSFEANLLITSTRVTVERAMQAIFRHRKIARSTLTKRKSWLWWLMWWLRCSHRLASMSTANISWSTNDSFPINVVDVHAAARINTNNAQENWNFYLDGNGRL